MTGMYMVIVIIVLFGTLFAEAANMGRCFDILISTTTEMDQCSSVDDFTECLIQELQLFQTRTSQSEITNLENIVKTNLAEFGLYCRVDFRAIILRIQEELEKGITHATRRSTGFTDAMTKGDCLNALITSNTAVGSIDCGLVSPFVKCIIRVTEYYKNIHTPTEDSSLLTDAQDHFGQLQVDCTIDIPVLSEEVARQITTSSGSAAPITATPISTSQSTTATSITTRQSTKATTTSTVQSTARNPLFNIPTSTYGDKSKTTLPTSLNLQLDKLSTCLITLTKLQSSGSNHCFTVNEFVKCLLDEVNLFKCNMTDREMGGVTVLVVNNIKYIAGNCDIDITTMIRKAQENDCKRIAPTTSTPFGTNNSVLNSRRLPTRRFFSTTGRTLSMSAVFAGLKEVDREHPWNSGVGTEPLIPLLLSLLIFPVICTFIH